MARTVAQTIVEFGRQAAGRAWTLQICPIGGAKPDTLLLAAPASVGIYWPYQARLVPRAKIDLGTHFDSVDFGGSDSGEVTYPIRDLGSAEATSDLVRAVWPHALMTAANQLVSLSTSGSRVRHASAIYGTVCVGYRTWPIRRWRFPTDLFGEYILVVVDRSTTPLRRTPVVMHFSGGECGELTYSPPPCDIP
jgi:hypothetical protein